MPVTLKPRSRRRAIWAPTPHPISRHVAPGDSCDTQPPHTRLTRWRPYRKGESKMLPPRYSARNPSAVSSWTSMALRRDHFSSEFISTGIDRLPLPCCSINRRSEFGNPSPVRLGQSAFQPSVANFWSRWRWKLHGRMGQDRRSDVANLAFTREHDHSVPAHEEHRRQAPPSSSSACHSALATRGSNRGWHAETPSFPVNRPRNCAGATIDEKASGDGQPSPWLR